MKAAAGSLVWLKGLRGPRPEKWPADFARKSAKDADAPIVLAEHELGPEEFALTIPILEQRYPAPK